MCWWFIFLFNFILIDIIYCVKNVLKYVNFIERFGRFFVLKVYFFNN